ncbi:putative glyoxalase superfamily protein PhnB [Sphingomonas zeicaulis]|uniref:VOC family protein n=1 Tax=Sphingomonas zeicaulis TaxID=1632740 RepID=UPI003D1B1A2B
MHHALIPCLRYKDAPAAIAFLCDAFGFERQAVYADDADPSIIHHAQLTLDGNMIMLGSADNGSESAKLYNWKTPAEAGGITMCVCAVIDDPDVHAARATSAGARIIRGPYDNVGYPGRAYDALDTEGNVWNFGSYDPFAA